MLSTPCDDVAFAETLELHRPELRDHCRRFVRDHSTADDLAQETIVRAWCARHRFEGRCSVRTWLYQIATNACLDVLRRNGRTDVVEPSLLDGSGALPREDLADLADFVVARAASQAAFAAAVRDLPSRQRTVVVLCDGYGWSARDAAFAIDGTVASANSALQRARATLRRKLVEPAASPAAP